MKSQLVNQRCRSNDYWVGMVEGKYSIRTPTTFKHSRTLFEKLKVNKNVTLQWAVEYGHLDIVPTLLWDPEIDHVKVVKSLLKNSKTSIIKTKPNRVSPSVTTVIDLLKDAKVNSQIVSDELFMWCARYGNIDIVNSLLTNKRINCVPVEIVYLAIVNKHYDVAKALLSLAFSNLDIPKPIKRKKQSIPSKIRIAVWKKYHGEGENGVCYACDNLINVKNWHCSHVVADIEGGAVEIDNLRTCCQYCNLSCGRQNLYTYIRNRKINALFH